VSTTRRGRLAGSAAYPGRVEGRALAALVVLRQLEVEALAVHPHGDAADARPGVEPVLERRERAIVRRARQTGEADRR